VEFTEEEITKIKADMEEYVEMLNDALSLKDISRLPFCQSWKCGSVERDSEKKEYFVKLRCPYAQERLCPANSELDTECQRKMDARRIVPDKKKGSGLTGRYTK
jgi:hypothetical protein